MRKKDGSLDKRFKVNKGLENVDLSSLYSELAEAEQELDRQEIQEKVIKKTINKFLNLSNSADIINEISDLTEYFMLNSNAVDMFGEEKQHLIWFDNDIFNNQIRFPDNYVRLVIDYYFEDGIKWDSDYAVNEEKEHSAFVTKFNRLKHLLGELMALEQTAILEIKKIAQDKEKKEQEKKPRIIENFGYCYNYDSNPLDELKFKQIRANHKTFADFLRNGTKDIYNNTEYNFCLKHLTNNELSDLEEHNRIDEDLVVNDELNESIQLEKQRRKSLNSGGFIKNIFNGIFKK